MGLNTLIRPRVCELGKIKIGGKGETRKSRDGGEYRLPVKYDHFVVTSLHRNDKGDLVQDQVLMEALKEYADPKDGKLRQLPVALVSNEIEDVLQASYVWYAGKQVAGRSDGKACTFFVDPQTQKALKEPLECEWDPAWAERDAQGNRRFKLHTVFHCMIAAKSAKFGGVYKFRTTSQITAEQLYGSLLQAKALTGGVLRGVPLRLVVRPMQVSPPPDHKPITVYVVHLEIVGQDLQAIQAQALERLKWELQNARDLDETRRQYQKLLAIPGKDESAEEQADVAEEFHPPDDPPAPEAAGRPAIANGRAPAGPADDPRPAPEPADEPPTLRRQVDGAVAELARLKGVAQGVVLRHLMDAARAAGLKRPAELDAFNDAWLRWSLDLLARWAAQAGPDDAGPRPAPDPAPTDPPPARNREPGDDDLEDAGEGEAPPEHGEPGPAPAAGPPASRDAQNELLRLLHELDKAWSEAGTREGCSAVVGRQLAPDAALSGLTAAEAEAYAKVLRALCDQKRARVDARRKSVADRREAVPS